MYTLRVFLTFKTEPKRNLHLMTKLLHFISYADMMIGRLRSEEHIALKIKRDDLLIRTEELRTHINQRVSECARNNNLIATVSTLRILYNICNYILQSLYHLIVYIMFNLLQTNITYELMISIKSNNFK